MLENIKKYLQNNDAILGIALISILVLIIIPLPGFILDALITVSFFSAILIILTSLASKTPSDFSIFPTLLLLTTIFRLALNISTTRMVLTEGSGASSSIIQVFGTFVVGGGGDAGSYVVGIIIFLILTLVQVLVITKGATRVSEVAARFALDSLPGKQLAIDSDLAAGYITEEEARDRREKLQTEMGFYGAMDGASKFVQGDVRFGLVMIAINIIGGLVVGTSIRGESFGDALEIYTRFTIGDGLVTAIPALLISSATGIIVSRSVGDESLPEDVKKQLLSNPMILYVVGSILCAASLIPGFPFFALFGIGALLFYFAYQLDKAGIGLDAERQKEEQEKKSKLEPESFLQHLRTETLEIEIGYNLVPLVNKNKGGTLLDQISRLRKRFAVESGLIVPPVRVRDNMNLEANEYLIRLQGSQIGKASLEPDKLMAIDTGKVTMELEGESFLEPSYQLKAFWIDADKRNETEGVGYDVVDCSTVIATQLSHVIQQNSSEIMGRREVKSILDSLREDNSIIVDEVLNEKKISLGKVQTILERLLREGVAIRNMGRILECIADNADRTQGDPYLLAELVRQSLRRQIVEELVDEKKRLLCLTLEPSIERKLRDGIHRDPEEGFIIALSPNFQNELRDNLVEEYKKISQKNKHPIFLCSNAVRAGLFHVLERLLPAHNFTVLANEEIPSDVDVEVSSVISLSKEGSVT